MAATEFPNARRIVIVLALFATAPIAASAAEENLKASASGTLVFLPAKKKQPPKTAQARPRRQKPTTAVVKAPASRKQPASKSSKFRAPNKEKQQTRAASPKQVKKQPARKDPRSDQIAQMLVHAHQLSQDAADEKQFNEIAAICSTAERLGAKGDQLEFAMQLQLWASKQRDELRMHQLKHQLKEDKSEMQLETKEKLQNLRAELTKQKLRAQQAEQKLEAERMARKLRSERIADQRETAKVVNELRKEISELKQRAASAEEELASQRAVLMEPEPIDVFAEPNIVEQKPTALPQPTPTVSAAPVRVVKESTDWETLHDEAITLAEQGRYPQALRKFDRVLELNPMFAKAFSNRATLHAQQGNLEMAAEDYKQACTIDVNFLHALIGLGRTYHQLGKLEESLLCMDRCIELDPQNPELFCSRADLHADMGSYREALADYAQTIDLAPEFAHAYRNGAWLLATCPDAQHRDSKNAIEGARQAIEFNYGERHVALDTLAAALASDGQYEQAALTMKQALLIAPNVVVQDYRDRLAAYQQNQPFFNQDQLEEEEEVQTATYEVSDR